jgi:tetratricopeptide (TPR) repeat protein/tRNA A-37 threonylcarbamoyl transferase component Bud32
VAHDTSNDPAARRRQVDAQFDEALELAPAARAEFLARLGERDPALMREVQALLLAAEHSGVTESLAQVVARSVGHHHPSPQATMSRYEIVEQVGAGGMGVVYKARDPRLERFVALKFLPTSLSADPELKLRFLQEAKTIASLDHPNLCTILEVVEPEAGQLVIVMPYYEGETLKQKVSRGPLPVPEVLDYAIQVTDGLVHAHAAGVVHRDIKPANIVVTPGGRVRILDFGIAKVARANTDFTRTGAILGTLSYMSPEQACGDPVDRRTDLWAVGVVLYEMLTSRPPFAADSMEALFYAIQWRKPARLASLRPEVPAALEALVHRLLEKEPARRYDDAGALATDLASVRAGGPTAAPVFSDTDQLERARAAFARTAWLEAYEGLKAVDATGSLQARDLERLAEAAWWRSDGETCVRARERAYRQYLDRDEPRAAASVALALAEDHFHRLARSVGQGWVRRAERHLEGLPERAEHGWLARLKFVIALDAAGSPDEAMAYAEKALDIARRVRDTDLEALALQDRGRALVAAGRVTDGLALIDEAMIAVTAGELTPRTAGRAYCNMLSTCERLGEFGRAAEWYDRATAWCEPHGESGYPGICRVHRAGILRLRGSLKAAEHEARRAAEELADILTDVAGEAYYEIGEIRLRMGDLPGANDMFREAHARGRDPQPGLALLRLAEEKPEAARAMIERALLEAGRTALDRAKLLPALVELRVVCGDVAAAEEGAAEMERITTTYLSPALGASAAVARGRVELARGAAEQAMRHFRRACRIYREINLRVDLAHTRLLLSRAYAALGNGDEAELEERAAREAMERIVSGAE